MNYHLPLQPDGFYHIFSRATGDEQLFLSSENYRYFLEKYKFYISPVADSFAWCLLPNHFHFLVQVRSVEELRCLYLEKKKKEPIGEMELSDFVMKQFSNLLNSYSKSFNKMFGRKGSLFMDYLRRVPITEHNQLTSTIFYIHKNPVHHGLAPHISE